MGLKGVFQSYNGIFCGATNGFSTKTLKDFSYKKCFIYQKKTQNVIYENFVLNMSHFISTFFKLKLVLKMF